MNCKPGDLAIQVRSAAANHGAIYTVLEWIGTYRFADGQIAVDAWKCRCEQRVVGSMGMVSHSGDLRPVRDSYLRPIRPGDISDEDVRDLYAPKLPEVA